jgi:hypothetical protein
MGELASMTQAQEPSLSGVWGFLDGLNLRVQEPSNRDLQNAHYNGWLGYCACSSLFVWGADGLARYAFVNVPGCVHDSGIASYGLYAKIETQPDGLKVVGDSAFRRTLGGLLVIDKSDTVLPSQRDLLSLHLTEQNAAVSLRQAAEWGMGSIQAACKRLKTRLPFNPKVRARIIWTAVYFLNFRTIHVGLNQIKTVFGTLQSMEDEGGAGNFYGKM